MFKFIKVAIEQIKINRDAAAGTLRAIRIYNSVNTERLVPAGYVTDGGDVSLFVGRKNTNKDSLVWGLTRDCAVDIEQGRRLHDSKDEVAISASYSV